MKIIVGNLKMNFSYEEVLDYVKFFQNKDYPNILFAPSHCYLDIFRQHGLKTIAQDVSSFVNGPHTGDISASQLKSMGITSSIIGHSERRISYDESKFIHEKLERLVENDIRPILCIGESQEERKNNLTDRVLKKEIDDAFNNIDTKLLNRVIIAYEPIWSISTSGVGIVPTNDEISNTVELIKNYLKEKYGLELKVLYGGSVNNNCIEELERINILDGYLVGGCSIKKEEFEKLIKRVG